MDSQRFDRFSRSLATRTTRRQAVRQVGAGGVLGGVAAVLGVKALQAQDSAQTCALPVYAEVYLGPWLGMNYQGTLTLEMNADGAIDGGALVLTDGTSYPLVGQATGRGLDLRIDLGSGLLLTLTGTAENDFARCEGNAAGSFSGPEMGNMGTWITTGPGQLTTSGGSGSAPVATETPGSCAAVSCFAPQTPNPVTCVCECPAPAVTCGGACCPPDAACVDADAGICSCPAGTVECGGECVAACGGGDVIDPVSCTCGEPCLGVDCELGQTLNLETCECEAQILCPGGTVACGDECVDVNNNPDHCFTCDRVCPMMPTFDDELRQSLCIAGDCCLDIDHLCAADIDCCSGSCDFALGGVRVCT